MLTDAQIADLAPRMGIPLAGIYYKNELPNLEIGKSYIVNLQNDVDEEGNMNPGTHWICFQIFRTSGGQLCPLFFDSFGFAPPKEIEQEVRLKTPSRMGYSTRQIQSPTFSGACGWYCMAWLHYMNRTSGRHFKDDLIERFNDFISMFDPENQYGNDTVLKQFFQSRPGSVDGVQPPENTSLHMGVQPAIE